MLLEMRNIYKSFPGVQALSGVSFDLQEGEIHGLVGENGAGKSTLVKILSGTQPPTEGEIFLDDELVSIRTPMEGRKLGIRVIYQEFSLLPDLSVMENITLCRVPHKRMTPFIVDWKQMRKDTKEVLDRMGIHIDPTRKVEDLGVAECQLVEIAKALYGRAKILIMDEPTAALGPQETASLLETVEKLKDEGVGIIYISHRLEEVMKICQRVTVFRDGQKVTTLPIEEVSTAKLVESMVGRKLDDMFPKVKAEIGPEVLRVENLSQGDEFRNVNFSVRAGEILGFAGLVGAGRTAMAQAIFGATKLDSGKIWVEGNEVKIDSPRDAIKLGICYLPEDRKEDGLILKSSLQHNITLSAIKKFSRMGWLNLNNEKNTSHQYVDDLNISTPSIKQQTIFLSGGNQQKVVVAKWLLSNAKVLIFDEPTRGIDVNAKVEIYQIMNQLVSEGVSIIMISSECPEILGMSDRVIVMREGRIVSERDPENTTEEDILSDCFCEITEEWA